MTLDADRAASASADPAEAQLRGAVIGAGAAAAACRSALLAAGVPVLLLRDAGEVAGRIRSGAPAPNVVAVDLAALGLGALDLMARVRTAWPSARQVAVAPSAGLNLARAAMEAGAFDFLVWPDQQPAVAAVLGNALHASLAEDGDRMLDEVTALQGGSEAAADLRREAFRLAPSKATVLIRGERGAGKRPLAALMHRLSARSGPLRRVDFSVLKIEEAAETIDVLSEAVARGGDDAGGTLVLERVCALPAGVQSRAMRLIDAAAAEPDLRVICTARDDLDAAVAEGRFRENVYYRLTACVVDAPPLRVRAEDVLQLATRGLARRAAAFQTLHPEVERAFLRHPWPDNLRQLDRTLDWAAARLEDGVATPASLPPEFLDTMDAPRPRRSGVSSDARVAQNEPGGPQRASPPMSARIAPLVGETLADVEAALFDATLARCGGSADAAARMLGVSPATVYRYKARARRAAAACNAPRSGPA